MLTKLVLLASAATCVFGHARVTEPTARDAGSSSESLCGAAVSKTLAYDRAGPIENAVDDIDADYNCNLFLCRGYQYDDNVDLLQTYSVGDIVDFHVDLVAAHRPGYANVSVIDVTSNTILAADLKAWEQWPVYNPQPDRDDIDFNVTIPDLSSTCTEGGICALQWFWYATEGDQTYESCVDFVIA